MLSSAMPSEGDGEAGFTDTLRPHADYGSRLNTDCLIRLVRLRQECRTRKTSNRQPVFLTPAPCMEFEPPRHFPFVTAHGGKECLGGDLSINSVFASDTYIALYRGCQYRFSRKISILFIHRYPCHYACRSVSPHRRCQLYVSCGL